MKTMQAQHIKMSGGITRLKQHLTHTKGDVTGCTSVTTEITKRVLASMQEKEKIAKEKRRTIEILRSDNTIDLSEDEDAGDVVQLKGKGNVSKKRKPVGASNVRGPLDSILKVDHGKTKQSTLDKNNPIKQNLKMLAWKKIATWAYTVGLPFNAVRDDSFQDMIYAVGEYGKGMPAPSYHNIRVTLLKMDALEDTKAHCVNLMIGDIGEKIPKIKSALSDARAVVVYIYNHGRVLNMMRRLTNNKELHRSCVTRFATQFYTLKSVHENRHHLQVLFVSETWTKSDFAKKAVGKRVERIVAKQEFWDNVYLACQVLSPLVDLVRLVDTEEKPCMGYIYDAMTRAKDQIRKNLSGGPNERLFSRVWSMVQTRWTDQFHHPLHAAGCFLNPAIFHAEDSKVSDNKEIKADLYMAIDKLVPDPVRKMMFEGEFEWCITLIREAQFCICICQKEGLGPKIFHHIYGGVLMGSIHLCFKALLSESLVKLVVLHLVNAIGAAKAIRVSQIWQAFRPYLVERHDGRKEEIGPSTQRRKGERYTDYDDETNVEWAWRNK
ncbi:zinc finger, CCHC-type containing protein [Tanacetum coccineum]